MTSYTRPEGARYQRRRRWGVANGTWRPPVPVHTVREHVATLRSAGMTVRGIAEASGLSYSTVAPVVWDHHSHARLSVAASTAEAILAVSPDAPSGRAHVLAIGTNRRLDALQWMGWPLTTIAERSGVYLQSLSRIRGQERVRVERAAQISALYDELSMTSGPSKATRAWALKRGAVGPLAWDNIDDPDETPNTGAVVRGFDLDEWAYLIATGESPQRAAERCGVTLSAVERAAERKGRPDVLALVVGARSAERKAS